MLVTPQGEAAVELAMPGRHNVRNALAAASLALGAGVPLAIIAEGLATRRSRWPDAWSRIASPTVRVLIDDSYNANPGSLAAAIDTLADASRATGDSAWLVLGDMRELGEDAAAMHAEVGRRAKAAGIARLFALGPLSAQHRAGLRRRRHAFRYARGTRRRRCATHRWRGGDCACW